MDADLIAKIKKLLEEDDPRITVDEYIIPPEIGHDEPGIDPTNQPQGRYVNPATS